MGQHGLVASSVVKNPVPSKNNQTRRATTRMNNLLDPVVKWGGKWYHFSQLVSWLHPLQRGAGRVRGPVILEGLRQSNTLRLCLNVSHAPNIMGAGQSIYRRYFGNETSLFLWGSAADEHHVPCILRGMNELSMGWYPINSLFYEGDPAIQVPEEALQTTQTKECLPELQAKKQQLLLPSTTA